MPCSLLLYSGDKHQPSPLVFASNRDRCWQFWPAHLPQEDDRHGTRPAAPSPNQWQRKGYNIQPPSSCIERLQSPGCISLKSPHSQSLSAGAGKHHSQRSGENPVIVWWKQDGNSDISVAMCVCLSQPLFLVTVPPRLHDTKSWHRLCPAGTFASTEN